MIEVKIGSTEELYYLIVKGHAKNDTEGSPEVCAACSAIAYTLLGWAVNNQFIKVDYEKSDGFMFVNTDVSGLSCSIKWEVAAVWQAIAIGLMQIEQEYPQFVSVNKE